MDVQALRELAGEESVLFPVQWHHSENEFLPVTVCYNTYGLNKAQIVYKVSKLFEVII